MDGQSKHIFQTVVANYRFWWRRYYRFFLFLIVAAAAFGLAVFMVRSPELENTGFLVIGALVAVMTTLAAGWLKRPADASDLARVIHTELADRVARCCFDYEAPWAQYDSPDAAGRNMDPNRLRRFAPVPPIIYPAAAAQLALLSGSAPQSLVKFYFRLAAWQRDVENVSDSCARGSFALLPDLKRLGRRIRETLEPGLDALNAFAALVPDAEEIEDDLLAGYDAFRKDRDPAYNEDPSLKRRLQSRIADIQDRRAHRAALLERKKPA